MRRQVNENHANFKEEYRDDIKRKVAKIGMGYNEAWLTNRFEHADTPDPSHNLYIIVA